MDKDFIQYKISRSRLLIKDLEEIYYNNLSSLKFTHYRKRIDTLTQYKEHMIKELEKYNKKEDYKPNKFVPKKSIETHTLKKSYSKKQVKKEEPIIPKNIKSETLNPASIVKENYKK